MQFQIVHQVGAPFEGQDWVTSDAPLFDSKEAAEAYLASGVLETQDPNCLSRQYTYYVREADQYPACIDEPPSSDEKCQHEYCPRHTIMWLESEGLSHEASIGLTAVLDYTQREYVGIVANALGGFDSFDIITDHHSVWDSGPLRAWYVSNIPLVVYCLEQTDWQGMDYWHQAQHHLTRIND